MVIESLLAQRGMTKYKLAMQAGIPHPTLSDICSGKTKLEKCSAETVYKLSQALGVSMEQLTEDGIRQTERERAYEYGLPDYLQHDLDAYKKGIKSHSTCWTVFGESSMAVSIWLKSVTKQSPMNTRIICGRNICMELRYDRFYQLQNYSRQSV